MPSDSYSDSGWMRFPRSLVGIAADDAGENPTDEKKLRIWLNTGTSSTHQHENAQPDRGPPRPSPAVGRPR